ncbi:MAG: hypothetical protein ACF8NJ_01125, partial [Phycisphaerales bacterium JB038]
GLASGSAYLFNAGTGAQFAKLLPADGAAADSFGAAVAIDGDLVLIGAAGDDDNGLDSGSAYVFDAATGNQLRKLVADDGAAGNSFGNSVALSGSLALIGATADDDNGADSGSAYVFDLVTGAQVAKLLPVDGQAGEQFGYTVAVDGEFAVIGAPGNDALGDRSGSVYLFDLGDMQQCAKYAPDDMAEADEFGFAVDISNRYAIFGAPYQDGYYEPDTGAAYIGWIGSALPGDLNFDGCVDQQDLGLLLAAFNIDDGGDNDGDGDTDASDLGILLAHYGQGC